MISGTSVSYDVMKIVHINKKNLKRRIMGNAIVSLDCDMATRYIILFISLGVLSKGLTDS